MMPPPAVVPALTYLQARALAAENVERDQHDPALIAAAVPRVYEHGRRTERSVVLFHGMTNCPQQMDELAQMFYARGCNVYAPRLPRHGNVDRLTASIGEITVAEILACAAESARIGAGLGERVSVFGLSLGATMALWLAQTTPIDQAIGLAPFLMPPFAPQLVGTFVMRVIDALPNFFLWWDPKAKADCLPAYAYPGFWTHCIAKVAFTGNAIFNDAARRQPAAAQCTVIVNAPDPAVNNATNRGLVKVWQAAGATHYELVEWNIGGRHDIIDPTTFPQARTDVDPLLLAMVPGA